MDLKKAALAATQGAAQGAEKDQQQEQSAENPPLPQRRADFRGAIRWKVVDVLGPDGTLDQVVVRSYHASEKKWRNRQRNEKKKRRCYLMSIGKWDFELERKKKEAKRATQELDTSSSESEGPCRNAGSSQGPCRNAGPSHGGEDPCDAERPSHVDYVVPTAKAKQTPTVQQMPTAKAKQMVKANAMPPVGVQQMPPATTSKATAMPPVGLALAKPSPRTPPGHQPPPPPGRPQPPRKPPGPPRPPRTPPPLPIEPSPQKRPSRKFTFMPRKGCPSIALPKLRSTGVGRRSPAAGRKAPIGARCRRRE